jgi:acyl-CoA synthetase (NDP forming)
MSVETIETGARDGLLAALRRHAFQIENGDWCVPEPFVKQALARAGVATPKGAVAARGESVEAAASALSGPVVLKAWGPGVVHKSELGAVRVGLAKVGLDGEGQAMLAAVAGHGVAGAQLYVEEMAPPGVEILFGVVARPPFGNLALLGAGGTNAELFGDPAVRLCPLTRETAREMTEAFRGAALLKGWRGAPPADVESLVEIMLAVAGEGGLVERLGADFAEFECNPLLVGPHGSTAADARLILRSPGGEREAPPSFEPEALFRPKSVAIVGASATRDTAWGNRTIKRYRQMGWGETLYAVHPTGDIEGVPTFRTLGDIPGGVDYAEISVAAEQAPAVLAAAKGKVKTAVITSAGFSETGEAGRALERELLAASRAGGVRFVGPNCMGVFSPRGRQGYSGAVSDDPGQVGAVFQSGGLATDFVQAGRANGLRFSNLASMGNAGDLKVSDIAAFLADDPDTRTIALHVEGGADARLIETVRALSGVKPVVILTPGLSAPGQRAAASHTGALTSDRRGWQALSKATGCTVTETFEEFLACVSYLDRNAGRLDDGDEGVLSIGLGGGASVLSADACDTYGLTLPSVPAALQARLEEKKGGFYVNPLDLRVGPNGAPGAAREAIEIVQEVRPFADVLIHLNALNYAYSGVANRLPGLDHFRQMLESLGDDPTLSARIAIVVRNLTGAPGSYRDEVKEIAQSSPLAVFERLSDAAAAMAAAKRFARARATRREAR